MPKKDEENSRPHRTQGLDPIKGKKHKVRKQLWDSLLEVYEKEASKTNLADCKDVEVCDLDKFAVNQLSGSSRGLSNLAQTKPQLINRALQTERQQSTLDNDKKEVRRRNQSKETSTFKVLKRKRLGEKSPARLPKKTKNSLDCIKRPAAVNVISKRTRINSTFTIPDSGIDNKSIYNMEHNNCINHILRYFCKSEEKSVRSDGRVFRCELVFNVCESYESDEVL